MSGYNEDYCHEHTVTPIECGCPMCEVEALRAQVKELRDVLEWVEWGCYRVSFLGDRMVHTCPFCGCIDENGHNSDCKLGNALKKSRGE